ncbi:uncharacterized protein TNCV_3370481 [Trichonephila clavipes]|nr:uncharacterized protein TNCV_3370481 [Trichonephila clavipes]
MVKVTGSWLACHEFEPSPTVDPPYKGTIIHASEGKRVAAVAEWYGYRIVACLVTSSSPVPLNTHRVGQRCMLNLSRAETSSRWCGVVVKRRGCQSSNEVICERRDPFQGPLTGKSKHHLPTRLCFLPTGQSIFAFALPSLSPSRGQHLSLGDQGGTFAALVASCQRWERFPRDVQKISGRSKLILRNSSKLYLCPCPGVDFLHKDAEHSCETKTLLDVRPHCMMGL